MSLARRLRRRAAARATVDRVELDFTWDELGVDPSDPARDRNAAERLGLLIASARAGAMVEDSE
jgi:hypothetical protein